MVMARPEDITRRYALLHPARDTVQDRPIPDQPTQRYTLSSDDRTHRLVVSYRPNEVSLLPGEISDGVPVSIDDDNETHSDVIALPDPCAPLAEGSGTFEKTSVVPVVLFLEKWRVYEELVQKARSENVRINLMEGWTLDEPPRHVINIMVSNVKQFKPWFQALAQGKFSCLRSLIALDELPRGAMRFQLEAVAKSLDYANMPNNWTTLKL